MRLFALDNTFIDSLCFGSSDDETTSLFEGALSTIVDEVSDGVRRAVRSSEFGDRADEFTVKLGPEGLWIEPPADIEDQVMERELGSPDAPPSPTLRQALLQSRSAAERAASRVLEMP